VYLASETRVRKEVLGPPHGSSIFEKSEGPKDFLLVAAELLQGQV